MITLTGTAESGRADKLKRDIAVAEAARDAARGAYDKAMSLAYAEFSKGAWAVKSGDGA